MNIGDKIRVLNSSSHPSTIGLIGELVAEISDSYGNFYLLKFDFDISTGCDGHVDLEKWTTVQGIVPGVGTSKKILLLPEK